MRLHVWPWCPSLLEKSISSCPAILRSKVLWRCGAPEPLPTWEGCMWWPLRASLWWGCVGLLGPSLPQKEVCVDPWEPPSDEAVCGSWAPPYMRMVYVETSIRASACVAPEPFPIWEALMRLWVASEPFPTCMKRAKVVALRSFVLKYTVKKG